MDLVTTAIPYINASPHIGFALELVLADVIARHAAHRRFITGSDDNSLKNALAAEGAKQSTAAFVEEHVKEFRQLRERLDLSYDDFLSTSLDPRHAPVVAELWRRCELNGDIYPRDYEGLYCVGCEQFYAPDELPDGVCPDHRTKLESVSERNYFFRLSRYQDALIRLIESDEIAVLPSHRKNEVLSFLKAPLLDLSISRSVTRARGWGIPVPGDSSQIIYVWFDALANYLRDSTDWNDADRISHVIGKGIIRFHAVYWPAILLSAGLRLPSRILVHGYVTIEGEKISKSLGNSISPDDACRRFGVDALRYYLLRHVGSHRDGDFSWSRFEDVYAHELADDLGNLVSRTTALGRKYGAPTATTSALAGSLAAEVNEHIEQFAVHRALDSIWRVVADTNAYINRTAPWTLAAKGQPEALAAVLGELYGTLGSLGRALAPFLPETAARLLDALSASAPIQLFPKFSAIQA